MSPIQQMLLGVGAVATKTYVDDIFSTYVYAGTGSARSINNAINLSGEGGLVWIKNRGDSKNHQLFDTERGAYKYLRSNGNNAETNNSSSLSAFNNNGFSVVSNLATNGSNNTYSSWSFRKAPGFCDVVTFTTSDPTISNRRISHNLGCVPGMIILKNRDDAEDWLVYHRHYGTGKYLRLSNSGNASTFSNIWGSSAPTSSDFGFNESGWTYANKDYVAYLFAGGESTAATARSVDFDGTTDALQLAASDDFAYGSQFDDFTIECWVYPDDFPNQKYIFDHGQDNSYLHYNSGKLAFYNSTVGWQGSLGDCGTLEKGQWSHIAVVRHSGYTKVYVNGTERRSQSDSFSYGNNTLTIGHYGNIVGNTSWDGKISNFRVVKGTAVYTSSFRPPTEPLTSITNTVLLCCNNSSTTGKTTGGTITAHNNVSASTDSPFDDPAAFTFGDSGDQDVIKCGSYVGNGSTDGPEIFLGNGWEPSWILLKNASTGSTDWLVIDEMRGISADSQKNLRPNKSDAEGLNEWLNVSSTGFQIKSTSSYVNTSGDNYIFMCLRRSDGYVGKPPELGTGVFAMDTSNAQTTIPCLDSNFIVDFALVKKPSAAEDWSASGRLISGKYLIPNDTNAEANGADYSWDSNVGWGKGLNSANQSWMFKRHAGFDCVNYEAGGVVSQRRHQLGRTPEMIWIKCRNTSKDWIVYHKGLNGGTNPQNKAIKLNTNDAEVDSNASDNYWDGTAPTATHFTTGEQTHVGGDGNDYIAMLFASVDGISKVGSYTGSAGTAQSISLGFTPRMLITKNVDSTNSNWTDGWYIWDTTRGWSSSSDNYLQLNDHNYEQDGYDWALPTSTGFDLSSTSNNYANKNGDTYIYYAHS